MTKFRVTSIALFLSVVALALASCGGDDEGSNNSASGTDATEAATGTTEGTTGTTETGSTETRERDRTQTRERQRDDKGGSSGGGGGSDDSSGSGGSGSGGSGGSKKRKSNAPETQLTNKNVESTSKTVCGQFLPTAIEKQLKDGKKSEEDVAQDYSRAYPTAERKSAYEGCLAGLKSKG